MNGIQKTSHNIRVADDVQQKSTKNGSNQSSGESSTEEQADEADEEDSSADQDEDDEDDDPEVVAPSGGFGVSGGKCPAIRVEHLGEDRHQENEEASHRGTGQDGGKQLGIYIQLRNKKRTFSNVSTNSVLFGDIDDLGETQGAFPRRKIARRLSNNSSKGLLTYKKSSYKSDLDVETSDASENAIASSDEETVETSKDIDVDDDDYRGVDLISDESDLEQQEDFLEKQEELLIINEEEQEPNLFDSARRFSLGSSGSCSFDFATTLDEDFFANNDLPDVAFGEFFGLEPEPSTPEPFESRKYSDSSVKRVRFDDEVRISDSSSSTTSELDSTIFPDLFMEQDKLPHSLYQMIENDADADMGNITSSDGENSYWDFGEDDGLGSRNAHPGSDDFEESSDAGSSGYETDLGDTTDEEDFPPPATVHGPKSLLRRPSSAASDQTISPRPFQRSNRRSVRKGGPPVCGVFVHKDWNKAIAVTDRMTQLVSYYRPRRYYSICHPNFPGSSTTSTANNSPCTSLRQMNGDDSDFSEMSSQPYQNPMDIMLTGVFGTASASNYLLGGQVIGPPEAFYPFMNFGPNGNLLSDEDDFDDDDDDDGEDNLNINDLLDFGSDGDDTDLEEDPADETDVPATPATSMIALNGSTPARPSPGENTPPNRKRNASDAMLEHFDRGVVTAFRNNQNRYRDIARLPHDPDLRTSMSRPVRSGRSAETLISPLRKRGSIARKNSSPSTFAGISKARSETPARVNGVSRGPRAGTFS